MTTEPRQERRKGSFITDALLKTVGTVMLTVSIALSGWALTTVFEHEGRIIRLETEKDSLKESLDDLKANIETLGQKIDRLIERNGSRK